MHWQRAPPLSGASFVADGEERPFGQMVFQKA